MARRLVRGRTGLVETAPLRPEHPAAIWTFLRPVLGKVWPNPSGILQYASRRHTQVGPNWRWGAGMGPHVCFRAGLGAANYCRLAGERNAGVFERLRKRWLGGMRLPEVPVVG